VSNSYSGIQTLGDDYNHPAQRGNGLIIRNNKFENIGRWFLTLNGFYNTTVEHNTHLQSHNIITLTGEPSLGFVYRNNVTVRDPAGFGIYGDGAGEGQAGLNYWTPGWVMKGNVIAGAEASLYPTNIYYPADLSGLSGYVGTDGQIPGYNDGASSNPTPT